MRGTSTGAATTAGTKGRFAHIVERATFVLSRAGAVGTVFFFFVWLPRHATRPDVRETDLYVYYQAAIRFVHGQPLYTGLFIYPPIFAALISPAAKITLPAFQTTWYALILGAYWAYAAGLARLAFGRLTVARVLACAALAELTPGMNMTMSLGNVDVVVWALCAWSLPDGAGLAAGACLKVYPGVLAAAAVLRRPRTAWRQLGVVLAGTLLVLALSGTRVFGEWFRAGGAVLPDCTLIPQNVSLSTAVLRLLGVADFRGHFAKIVYAVVPLVVIGVTFVRTRRWSGTAAGAALLVATVWSAPICWLDWLPILDIPLVVWVRVRSELSLSLRPAASP